MEGWLIVGVYILVAVLGFVKRDRTLVGAEVSLCLTCVNSVVTRGTRNEEWVACNYGGAMRAVKFIVCSCSGYCAAANQSKVVTIEGFVRDDREVYAEITVS